MIPTFLGNTVALLLLTSQAGGFQEPVIKGSVGKPLDEVSGLAASRRHKGVLWTHNDSGDGPHVYAISDEGLLLATFKLVGVSFRDVEDMAIGPGPNKRRNYLYIGDVGNNRAHAGQPRPFVTVHRFPEPELPKASVVGKIPVEDVESITLTYPDGAHDVETLLVDPLNGDLYLCTKRDPHSRIYRLPAPVKNQASSPLTFVGEFSLRGNTAGDVSPDGRMVLIKDYTAVYYFARNPAQPLWVALTESRPVPVASYVLEPQGEAIAFDAEGQGFFTLSEARGVQQVDLFYYPAR